MTTLDQGKLTAADQTYRQNQEAGMDKYKTMKKAQSGTWLGLGKQFPFD